MDQVYGSSRSGIFNLLFMPGNFIYLLANFIIRPALPIWQCFFSKERKRPFRKQENALFKKVALLSLVLFLLALIFSGLALRILEWILGSSFFGKFTGERLDLLHFDFGRCFLCSG